jgi:hypothetical protein
MAMLEMQYSQWLTTETYTKALLMAMSIALVVMAES